MLKFLFPFTTSRYQFLEKKWQHRLLKVLFGLIMLIVVLFSWFLITDSIYHHKYLSYQYKCIEQNDFEIIFDKSDNNKTEYNIVTNKITPSEIFSWFKLEKDTEDNIVTEEKEPMMTEIFPWFDNKQIKQLEKDTEHLPFEQRLDAQKEIYQQVLPIVQDRKIKEERIAAENRVYQQSLEEKDEEKRKFLQMTVRASSISTKIKEKIWAKMWADDNEFLKAFIETYPDKEKLLSDYILDWNPEVLYDLWLAERPVCSEIHYWLVIYYIEMIVYTLLASYIISLILQLLYYKAVLYVVYGKIK